MFVIHEARYLPSSGDISLWAGGEGRDPPRYKSHTSKPYDSGKENIPYSKRM